MSNLESPPTPITRALILKCLRDPDSDNDDDVDDVASTILQTAGDRAGSSHNGDDADILAMPDMSFTDMRRWLEHQLKKYQIQTNETFDTDAAHNYRETARKERIALLDTTILERIRSSDGSQEAEYEDLLGPLRLVPNTDSGSASRSTQTYEEMRGVIETWNSHVAKRLEPEPGARESLLYALRARIAELHIGSLQRQSADALRGTARQLLDAIQAYRPETAEFRTQDYCTILLIMLAHVGLQGFDIDEELTYWIVTTLIQERAFAPWAVERNRLIRAASQSRRRSSEPQNKHQNKGLNPQILGMSTKSIIRELQTARRNLEGRYLTEMYNLGLAQSAQKSLLKDYHIVNTSVSSSDSARYTPAIFNLGTPSQSSQIDLTTEDSTVAVLSQTIDRAHDTHRTRVFTRAVKFAGKDLRNVSSAERLREVQKRLRNPKTIKMMANAVAGMRTTKGLVSTILEGVDTLAMELDEAGRQMAEDHQSMREWLEVLETNAGFGKDEEKVPGDVGW